MDSSEIVKYVAQAKQAWGWDDLGVYDDSASAFERADRFDAVGFARARVVKRTIRDEPLVDSALVRAWC